MADISIVQTTDRILLISTNKRILPYGIAINKSDFSYSRYDGTTQKIPSEENVISTTNIQGCLIGVAPLLSGRYLIVADKTTVVAQIPGVSSTPNNIYRVDSVQLIPFHANQQSLITIPLYDEEQSYLEMLQWILQVKSFYFSFTTDITHTRQREITATAPDQRFFWNRNYVTDFQEVAKEWVVPLTMGFVKQSKFNYAGQDYRITLMSRRNHQRAGTRYYQRGADQKGNVANNVETEQIFESLSQKDTYTSFVQIRGSVPLLWSQFPNLAYKPRVKFYGSETVNQSAVRTHFSQLYDLYGDTTIVNLIDKKSDELKLGEAYEKGIAKLSHVKYIWFDFHAICKGMRYDKLSILMDMIKDDIQRDGFFMAKGGSPVQRQKGIVRTNCIDNLDRTNVVQTLVSKQQLVAQLTALAIDKKLLDSPQFDSIYKNMWADHADVISTQYSGTGALKNDYTRTGKRSTAGLIQDGENSLKRYYLNNFIDGFRQDAFDLFTGVYKVDAEQLRQPKHPMQLIWIAFVLLVALFIYTFILPSSTTILNSLIVFIVFWLVTLFITAKSMKKYNNLFVDKPFLVKPEETYRF
ncbi:putative phosphoinositide phosphatase [Heterostelium album PN500]|uniref:Putative phosphoinositide phosphatase n=1 Tax=Heterostelium pallidum (strain ATCC 26659 / Pp 5 / PN500) TaxID=670386 RepID=D3BU70_HETP5|nr:putative phosphoinositide phosphatase [Heterostelium album PN500]EFA75004.1 putative phosphoinositide phosphatase [Heterostelium album PN500]|eukprot:XP_020427138.1 putative phosphoinositide phosphatase [Heterostelium album PN500]